MSRGRFTVCDLDVAISRYPVSFRKVYGGSEYDMRIMGADNTAKIHHIPKSEAERMIKKINTFKREIKAEMMNAARKYDGGKR